MQELIDVQAEQPVGQSSQEEAPAAEYLLAAQGVHSVTVPPAEYVPAAQVTQEPLFRRSPALHVFMQDPPCSV